MEHTDNLNIKQFKPLITPDELKKILPENEQAAHVVAVSRKAIAAILTKKDKRKLVIVGPCSIHDREAALEYAKRLKKLQDKLADKVLLIMRTYFEKPRTTLGWKGMLYDPHLDGSYDIEEGIRGSRSLLLQISQIGIPCATEFLDPIVPQYFSDLISWAAIGARTAESQIHRQMASGLSMPVGFKNATDGNLNTAIDAITAAAGPHSFLGIDRDGKTIIAETKGNKYGHLVMRGGTLGTNYASEYVAFAEVLLKKAKVHNGIIIDCSHANSDKDFKKQARVVQSIAEQIESGNKSIAGIMLESFLEEGKQDVHSKNPVFGQSVTDSCIGWDETEELIRQFAKTAAG
ncbi:MAG: 3-deoxy-7-phosphoheptulonate synthase [Phycisphaerae bacterium]|nr:3-deoxy-7-phosphoheptulonate synthase [Phycisphaerae bacterium]